MELSKPGKPGKMEWITDGSDGDGCLGLGSCEVVMLGRQNKQDGRRSTSRIKGREGTRSRTYICMCIWCVWLVCII